MADPVKTPSKTPNQPAVETPAAAAPTPVVAGTPAAPAPTPPAKETPTVDPSASPVEANADNPAAPPAEPTADPKPADPAVAAKAAEPKVDAPVIPENYEIKLPEALTKQGVQLNPDVLPALTPAFKKAGLTQAQVQTVGESFIEFQAKVPAAMLARDLELTMKDPDLGGLNYGRTQASVNAALAGFTTPEFRTLLDKSGLANNLEFVRVFERIGKAMQGDSAVRGGPDSAPQTSRAERLYGKTSPST